ncbi:hypothetical protein Barb7_03008 [Bacteroidales bacterium Barb7]|nr:hypothetical protein Barb7_03008 [Bacteroidales bacterium Barb7]
MNKGVNACPPCSYQQAEFDVVGKLNPFRYIAGEYRVGSTVQSQYAHFVPVFSQQGNRFVQFFHKVGIYLCIFVVSRCQIACTSVQCIRVGHIAVGIYQQLVVVSLYDVCNPCVQGILRVFIGFADNGLQIPQIIEHLCPCVCIERACKVVGIYVAKA